MALQRSGCFTKSGGVNAAISKHLKIINLKPVKKITIQYDPFNENVHNIREFNVLILSKKVVKTNASCLVRTNIASDRSESEVTFNLVDGKNFIFKCANLTTLELLELTNKLITPLAPVEEVVDEKQTKGLKRRGK